MQETRGRKHVSSSGLVRAQKALDKTDSKVCCHFKINFYGTLSENAILT